MSTKTKFQKRRGEVAAIVENALRDLGWSRDRWGKWISPKGGLVVRFNDRVIRFESAKRVDRYGDGKLTTEFVRIRSLNYDDKAVLYFRTLKVR